MHLSIDCTISNYQNLKNLAMAILPGGLSWEKKKKNYREIAEFVKK
ncbi:hypothetical protein TEMA_04070 [Terrisporobacter mayombei]|uniref:Uncharacterized protein n=1 Tax=Terrisporobacter mayombei TaxID=1541 RepID=A0ABY9PZB0_9FIRM|nr:hypothetical protein TEMA_04070 [Terrisporobacter mayombei]